VSQSADAAAIQTEEADAVPDTVVAAKAV